MNKVPKQLGDDIIMGGTLILSAIGQVVGTVDNPDEWVVMVISELAAHALSHTNDMVGSLTALALATEESLASIVASNYSEGN